MGFYQADRYKFSSFKDYKYRYIVLTENKIHVLEWREDAEKYIPALTFSRHEIVRCHYDSAMGVPYVGIEFKNNIFFTYTYRKESKPPLNCQR